MKLGIFDSGIGGEAIALSLKSTFPDAKIITVNDHKNIPYGNKPPDQIIRLTDTAIQPLLLGNCDVIVIACNTATAAAIETLRIRYPNQKFIGIEPMIKIASSMTKTKTIAVCATPATLSSNSYRQLLETYGEHLTIIEPDCSNWALMIENNQISKQQIEDTVDHICKLSADVIVLGCTHYLWIKDIITETAKNRAQIIEPSVAIAKRVASLLNISSLS